MSSAKRKNFISLILLAGGTGSRMGGSLPKQFRLLAGKPLALHSSELFDRTDAISEIVIVCAPDYRHYFADGRKPQRFALPGPRRQDSVCHGLLAASPDAELICIHDSARPFPPAEALPALFAAARREGAAALAAAATNTIKEASASMQVVRTIPRSVCWETQTPQALRRDLLEEAYRFALANDVEATDDLSLLEAMGRFASLVPSTPRNFKITTPFDWAVAEALCAASN